MGSLFLLFSEELWYYNNNHIQKAEGVCENFDFAQVKREAGASPARSRHRDSLAFFITTGEVREGKNSAANRLKRSVGRPARRCIWETRPRGIGYANGLWQKKSLLPIFVCLFTASAKSGGVCLCVSFYSCLKKASVWREIWRKL